MKKLLLLSLLALAFPVAALADDPAPPAQSADAACTAQKTGMGADGFKAYYGTNANKANAWGKCVSKMSQAEASHDSAAATACAAERDDANFAGSHGGKSFAQVYGTSGNANGNGAGKNAFGKCVSSKSDAADAAVQAATVSAGKACKTEQAAGRAAFTLKYGTGAKKANAFGKCVSSKAQAS